ncbi:TetR/AcrR family transcriptional regulator [Streptomyces sp. NPDC057654]|uniref:TetR/AcrR family transcriptional regulator n=1 Tax=Streptomyces sp. NPDC057654 TaxID=3346196 RepID=UPI0036B519A2
MAASGRTAGPEVIWARPERAGRGPRPAHTRAEIAAAATGIADAEGIDAVSMRRVAAAIGCGTMSLYNYVPRKEDLYELMVDAAAAEYELPEQPSGDWQADLLGLARQSRAMMHRHPWMPGLMSPVYGFSPNALRYVEYVLWVLDGLDVEDGAKMELLAMVTAVVTSFVGSELTAAERHRTSPHPPEQERAARSAYLARELAGGRYPRMARTFAGASGPADQDAVFERAMRRLFAGFAAESGGRGGGA